MRVDAALRLLAVPLCGALVYAAVMPVIKGLSATSLFTGLLYGFIVSMAVGVPLLLLGDRFFPASKARHIVSSLLQSLLIYVVYGGFSGRLLLVAIVGGLVLGLLYTAVAKGIERYAAKHQERQQGKAYVLGIPLCGGIPVAVLITSAIGDGSGTTLTSWIFLFLVGAGLSMLAGPLADRANSHDPLALCHRRSDHRIADMAALWCSGLASDSCRTAHEFSDAPDQIRCASFCLDGLCIRFAVYRLPLDLFVVSPPQRQRCPLSAIASDTAA